MFRDHLAFGDGYYRKNGQLTKELALLRIRFRPIRQLYGQILAEEFGPLGLKTFRQSMLDFGLRPPEINQRIGTIIRAVKPAVESESIPLTVIHGLKG